MNIKLGVSQYPANFRLGDAFYYNAEVYVLIEHGEDNCKVRKVATRGENNMLTFVSCEIENFNSYGDVKPITIE